MLAAAPAKPRPAGRHADGACAFARAGGHRRAAAADRRTGVTTPRPPAPTDAKAKLGVVDTGLALPSRHHA
jgi:hypothetical protein